MSLKIPMIGQLGAAGRAGDADPVADAVAMVARPVLLDHHLPAAGDFAPLDKAEVVGLVALCLVAGDQHLALGALDRAVVPVQPREHAADHSGGIANTPHVLYLVNRVFGHRAAALAHHDQVGLAPGGVDDFVEGRADRAREKQDAEDHPHSEDHAERGQGGAQRPRAQLAERDRVEGAQHRAS